MYLRRSERVRNRRRREGLLGIDPELSLLAARLRSAIAHKGIAIAKERRGASGSTARPEVARPAVTTATSVALNTFIASPASNYPTSIASVPEPAHARAMAISSPPPVPAVQPIVGPLALPTPSHPIDVDAICDFRIGNSASSNDPPQTLSVPAYPQHSPINPSDDVRLLPSMPPPRRFTRSQTIPIISID